MLIAGIDTLTGKILHYNVHVLFRAILVTDIFCSHGQSRLKLYAFKLLHSVYIFQEDLGGIMHHKDIVFVCAFNFKFKDIETKKNTHPKTTE